MESPTLWPYISIDSCEASANPLNDNVGDSFFEVAGQMDMREHWDRVYQTKAADQVSWFRPHLESSLADVERAAKDRSALIIDIGGGASTLVDDLLDHGYRNLTVLDISQTAIELARKRLGEASASVEWLCAEVTQAPLPENHYDVWHDRAVFHFLTEPSERLAYAARASSAIKTGGHLIISAFGPEGPERCSGLDTMRYDAQSLHRELGRGFHLMESSIDWHRTPSGAMQQFLRCHFRLER